jgi:iron-sulfur cluster repair protein YtfE (RIC family)
MKRSEALAELSRDHHQALFVAQRLRRAGPETAVAAREAFLEFWATEGRRHFRDEEEILLPAFARHEPPTHEAVVRVLTDHIDLRRRAGDLGPGTTPSLDDLRELGERLHAHVRHEERVLFPMIEAVLSTDELVELAASLVSTQASASR